MLHGGVPLDRYAAIGACLRYFPRGRKAEVLQRLALQSSEWEAARVAWSAAIEESTAAGGSLLADWSQAFERFGERLRELSPTVETLDMSELLPGPAAAANEPAAEVTSQAAAEPPQRALPSYLKEPRVGARPRPSPATQELSTADMMPVPARGAALPFAPAPGPPPTAIAAAPRVAPRARHPLGSGTADIATPRRPAPALPFQVPPSAQPSSKAVDSATKLTMNQYAALKAELAASAADAASLWSKYGVEGEAGRDAVEQHWQTELARDPAKKRHFEAVCGQYFRQWAQKPR